MAITKETSLVPAIEKEALPIIKRAAALFIGSPEEMRDASELLTQLNRFTDRAEEEKDKVLKPLNAARAAELKRWKPLLIVFEDAIGTVRSKMTTYQTKAKEAADIEADRIAARVGAGKGHLSAETAVKKIDAIDKPAQALDLGDATVEFVTVRKFEVVSLQDLPLEYHLADETAIRAAMRAGTELPGVHYYTEQQPRNTR